MQCGLQCKTHNLDALVMHNVTLLELDFKFTSATGTGPVAYMICSKNLMSCLALLRLIYSWIKSMRS